MNKTFENLKHFLIDHINSFKIVLPRETWLKDENANKNTLHQISNYTPIYLKRNGLRKGGGTSLFVHNSLNYMERHDLSKTNDFTEILSIEIIN